MSLALPEEASLQGDPSPSTALIAYPPLVLLPAAEERFPVEVQSRAVLGPADWESGCCSKVGRLETSAKHSDMGEESEEVRADSRNCPLRCEEIEDSVED